MGRKHEGKQTMILRVSANTKEWLENAAQSKRMITGEVFDEIMQRAGIEVLEREAFAFHKHFAYFTV